MQNNALSIFTLGVAGAALAIAVSFALAKTTQVTVAAEPIKTEAAQLPTTDVLAFSFSGAGKYFDLTYKGDARCGGGERLAFQRAREDESLIGYACWSQVGRSNLAVIRYADGSKPVTLPFSCTDFGHAILQQACKS